MLKTPDKFFNKVYYRARNLGCSWLFSYAAGVGFRYLINYLHPNGQLAQSLFQPDEIIRGPIGYAGMYILDKVLRRYAREQRYLLKPLALLASIAFETSQHLSPIPNHIIEDIGLGVDSTILGSVEDGIMDMTTILSYESDTIKKHQDG